MLALDDPRWNELSHAYGKASDIPDLLRQLYKLPDASGNEEPWFSVWSALAHQGDVYSASFAAVPHVVEAIARDPMRAHPTYLHFPVWVECCRVHARMQVPHDLRHAYEAALSRLPSIVANANNRAWNEEFLLSALAAIAIGKGQPVIAEAVLELEGATAGEFLQWLQDR
jgi:hypothetical protein